MTADCFLAGSGAEALRDTAADDDGISAACFLVDAETGCFLADGATCFRGGDDAGDAANVKR